jgi:hypothetical protein
VGIAASSARRWLKDPLVIQRLAEARRDAMNRAIARLQEAAIEAVDCLCEVQRDGESESTRVSAARTILEQALRAVELGDVLERLGRSQANHQSHNAFTPGPRISVSYEKDGRENDRQNGKAPSAGSGTFGER